MTMMRSQLLPLLCLLGTASPQFPGASLFSNSWSQGLFQETSLSQPVGYGQPMRPSPFGYGYGNPAGSASSASYEDPIPPVGHDDASASFDVNHLPAKLPIRAPNGVVEIYNRVVDDLLVGLKSEFRRRAIDPMDVVIRPTPPGPVRVPGHLQKRPFRRPGAALYRSTNDALFAEATGRKVKEPQPKATPAQSSAAVDAERNLGDEEDRRSEEPSSEEIFFKANNEKEDHKTDGHLKRSSLQPLQKKEKKVVKTSASEEEEDAAEGKKDVETLLQKYQSKNEEKQEKRKKKPSGGGKKKRPAVLEEEVEDEAAEEEEEEDDEESLDDDLEPGTLQSGGDRPTGGYYPQNGPPPIPPQPNAQLTGLSRIRRTSDVVVGIDARSAVITARLTVGPVSVLINESAEPQEKNLRATIPELEAEMTLMERHGVVMLQRFTLDRAYGEDVEISIPKRRHSANRKKGSEATDMQSLATEQRYHTKMAAHITMEVVRLLRSGNLRVHMMRTAQSAMGQLTLPIKPNKKAKRKGNKGRRNKGRQ